ncbi:sacsin N-terminal ATP-binding-like domain-containing protein [Dokdonia ponticola]|uniref:Sacsin N-terminal ATP-binding-like domain-containing protein n=1 Tax=Dokdonia ponticola TaxID=2041041 RepID=A0ABV9HVK6_9FLAO
MEIEEEKLEQENIISFDDQIRDTEIEKKLSIPAKRLMEKLEPIPSKIELLQFRWFWELIQNASDFNEEVDVELELKDDLLIFRHNGKPFKIVDVENLITPDSDKDDEDIDEDYIGRFGSGFISTHALSAVITVEGLVKDKYREKVHYKFKFDLDRTNYNSKKLLIDSIQKSEDQFKKEYKISDYVSGSFDTVFTYDLTKGLSNIDSKGIATSGIEYAIKVLPLVFTFLPKLKSVKFIKNGVEEKHFYQKSRDDQTELCEIGLHINLIPQNDIKVKYAKQDGVIVAREIKDNVVAEYSEEIAVLFLYLPLIGSEKFPFPISINSQKFKPETERNGISISNNDINNRSNLLNGVKAYKRLLQNLAEEGVGNLYHLVQLKSDRIKALSTGSDWFQKNIEKEIKIVLDEVEFVNCNGIPISYAKLKLPFIPENKTESRDLEFYDTVSDLIVNEVPSREEYLNWLKNIDFTIFKSVPFRLEAAVKIVAGLKNLVQLAENINKDEEETVKWLAKFIKYVKENDNGLLAKYKIIPCQSEQGSFVNRDAEIYTDNGVDTDLIEVYNKMKNQDYRFKLLNKTINKDVPNLLPEAKYKTWKTIAKEIDDIFRLRLDANSRLSKNELEGLSKLLKWLKKKGFPNWSELPTYFPTFNSSYTNFFLESFDEEERVKAITIRDSGKQDSLLKLAESEVTVDELNKVVESISDIKEIVNIIDSGANLEQLTELAKLFPNKIPSQIMDFAREEGEKTRDFNAKSKIGSDVEKLFKSAFEKNHLGLIVDKVDLEAVDFVYAGGGSYDFRITNPKTGQSFYIEMKSVKQGNKDSVKLAISQLERAVNPKYIENYCIALIERTKDIKDMDEEYVLKNLKFIQNPGTFLNSVYEDHKKVIESTSKSKEVKLLMLNADFRCSIDYEFLKGKSKSIAELEIAVVNSLKN